MSLRLSPDRYHEMGIARGLTWLGPEAKSSRHNTWWQCEFGHILEMSYRSLYDGARCRLCSYEDRAARAAHSHASYHELARQRGMEWLGPPVPTSHSKTRWRGQCGHEWEATYLTILHSSGRCRACRDSANGARTRLQADDYHALAESGGVEWIGPEVPTSHVRTWWRCPEGHEWRKSYANMIHKSDCPHCRNFVNGSRVSRPQRIIHALVGGELNHRVGNYRVDVALETQGVKIALEFDCWYWHQDEAYDRKRDAFLIKRGWHVVHFRSAVSLPTRATLAEAVQRAATGEQCVIYTFADWEN